MTTTGLTISAIREALAAQIRSNINRDVTVRAYRPAPAGPSITIDAAGDYVDYWVTFSGVGISAARFDLAVDPAGSDLESSLRRLDDFLSAGAGNSSSILDALALDDSLGLADLSAQVVAVSADPPSATAVVTVEVHVNKTA